MGAELTIVVCCGHLLTMVTSNCLAFVHNEEARVYHNFSLLIDHSVGSALEILNHADVSTKVG